MKLFDSILERVERLLPSKGATSFCVAGPLMEEGGPNDILFHSDTALELGGMPGVPSPSGLLLNSGMTQDEILLYGPDLKDIRAHSPYARIAIVDVDDAALGQGNALYSNIRKIDYTRFHVAPKGCMVRISSMDNAEVVAIGKEAMKKGLSFADLGRLYLAKYKAQPAVRHAKIVFVTDPKIDYASLKTILSGAEDVTKALDHLLNKVSMDCHSCSLQQVCEQVEGLVKEDFPDAEIQKGK